MKVLVVGSGGREHALAWKLLQSPEVEAVFCVPGNGGTAQMERCYNQAIASDDFAQIAAWVGDRGIDWVLVGPEAPLARGIADYLAQHQIPVFGPTQQGAQIESSKSWAKALMSEVGVPTAKSQTFTDAAAAKAYIRTCGAPIVVKADGLAAGKGVAVATTVEEAMLSVERLLATPNTVVVEEYLPGWEVSLLALTDGISVRPLLPACDRKRIGEGDTGPNTGGMGAIAPAPVSEELMQRIEKEILQPVVAGLQRRQIDYCGVLYAGLMITPAGEPKVLEFNCRFGDPETQAILPLLKTSFAPVLKACCDRRLASLPPLQWYPGSATCVVAASKGYPGAYQKGYPISGLEQATQMGAYVFHAGTRLDEQGQVLTDGGRVLNVVATGENGTETALAYRALSAVKFEGIYYRRDLGFPSSQARRSPN